MDSSICNINNRLGLLGYPMINTKPCTILSNHRVAEQPEAVINIANTAIHLDDKRCADLAANNIKVNDAASFFKAVQAFNFGMVPMVIPSYVYMAAILFAFRHEALHAAVNYLGDVTATATLTSAQQTAEYQIASASVELGVRQTLPMQVTVVPATIIGVNR